MIYRYFRYIKSSLNCSNNVFITGMLDVVMSLTDRTNKSTLHQAGLVLTTDTDDHAFSHGKQGGPKM